jgi:hypothetical protein
MQVGDGCEGCSFPEIDLDDSTRVIEAVVPSRDGAYGRQRRLPSESVDSFRAARSQPITLWHVSCPPLDLRQMAPVQFEAQGGLKQREMFPRTAFQGIVG